MSKHEMIAAMLGLLGILILGGFVILSRDLVRISQLVERGLEISEQILKGVKPS
ncbi:MAG: hypothetical protein HYZ72_02080 [Deltaproteobacteria bacterium]|nr:hypothetical protein [Deltaproteobacteria bacterium]